MKKATNNTEERRKRPRYKINANCFFDTFEHALNHEDYSVCKIDNIGLGGLSFLTDNLINLQTRLIFTIAIQKSFKEEPIDAVGDVIWTSPYKFDPNQFQIGVKFVKMLDDDLLSLTHQIYA